MKRIHKLVLFTSVIAALAISGCKKGYLDVNDDPNNATDNNITGELIFTQAENAVGQRIASVNFTFLEEWMGYFASNGGFAPVQDQITYNIDFGFSNNIWANNYAVLFDLYLSRTKGLASKDTALAAASLVLQAKLFQETVDLFGNIPYSQAFGGNKLTLPAYDKAQDIYNDLQKKLDTAINWFQTTTAPKAFTSADIIAHGDITTWVKFANTLKLRLLIRQSEVPGFDPSAEITKIQAKGGVLGAGETISVNPGYVDDVNKQNIFYSNYGFTPTGTAANNATAANDYIVNLFLNDNDPRVTRFFYPVGFSGSNYVGAKFGDLQENLPTAAQASYFGPALIGNLDASHKGDGSGAKQAQWILPSVESMFLYAEAVARGWIGGSAQAAYENAVTESFVSLKVPDSLNEAAFYLANADDAKWANAGTTALSKAKFIAFQKYLALTGLDVQEAYADLRRLNMLTDNGYLSVAAGAKPFPVRLFYPQSEYTANATNVQKEGTVTTATKIFWQP